MPPPTVLKRRHSLQGKNLMPLAVQFRNHDGNVHQYARPKMNKSLENMHADDLISAYRDITGTSEKDIFELSGKQVNDDELRLLVHLTILYANKHGRPVGQELVDATDTNETDDDQPPLKKAKHTAVTPSGPLSPDPVKKLKDKVRFLAMQKTPSEQLVLLTLDELADTARSTNHEDADMFQELARQANMNQGKFNVPAFVLNILGGKASDLISKALSKSLKEKSTEKKEDSPTKSTQDTASGQMQYPWNDPGFMWPYWQPGMGYMPQISQSVRRHHYDSPHLIEVV